MRFVAKVNAVLDSRKARYLIAGGWNTLFGYGVGVGLYYGLSQHMHVIGIGALANVLAITMAFLTYKLFVFQTKGNWAQEYLRCYLVYGGIAILGIALLWATVDGLHMQIWLAQGIVILVTVIVSYTGHARFTFRKKNDQQLGD
ncbi:MAG: GtrA family protein [Sulfuricaulis sp.]